MASNGFVANVSKEFKGEDGSKSPSVPQEDPTKQKPKLKLGDEIDEPVYELDLLRILDEQSKNQETATLQLLSKDKDNYKVLLAEHAQTTASSTNQTLSSFAVATQKQFDIVDTRIGNVEEEINSCKMNTEELRRAVASMQAEQ